MKKVFQIKLKSLTRVFAMVMALSLVTFTGCKSYDGDIDQLNADLVTLKGDYVKADAAVTAAINLQIESLKTEIAGLKTRLLALEAEPAGVTQAQLDAVKKEILEKTVSLESFNAYKTDVADQLAAIKATADAAATDADLAALEARLNNKIVEINATLEKLGAKDIALQGSIDALQAVVDGALVKLTAAEQEIDNLRADINARLAVLEGLLNIKDGKSVVIDDIKAQLTDQLAKITANTALINTLRTDLTTLEGKVTQNTKDIEELRNELKSIDLGDLSKKLNIVFAALSTRLTSLTYIPTFYVNGIEAINLSSLLTGCGAITPEITMKYHLNPSFITYADVDTANLAFAVIKSTHLISFGGGYAPSVETRVKARCIDISNGIITVGVSVNDYEELLGEDGGNGWVTNTETFHSIALQIPLSEKAVRDNSITFNEENGTITVGGATYPTDRVITGQYVRLYGENINAEDLSLAKNIAPAYPLFPETLAAAKALAVTDPSVIELTYNEEMDLLPWVTTMMNGSQFSIDYYNLVYSFDLNDEVGTPISYKVGANQTEQQKFIVLNGSKIKTKVYDIDGPNPASVDRTPIVHVMLVPKVNPTNCKVIEGFIKINIVKAKVPVVPPIVIPYPGGNFEAGCNDSILYRVGTQEMNEKFYAKTLMSKTDFHSSFVLRDSTGVGTVTEVTDPLDNQSYNLIWTVTSAEQWANVGKTITKEAYYVHGNSVIKITFTATIAQPVANLGALQIDNYWKANKTYIVHNVAVPALNSTDPALCTYENNINNAFKSTTLGKLDLVAAGLDATDTYEYVFDIVANQPTVIKDEPGTLEVKAGGKELWNAGELVATINGDTLEYAQTDEAKRLLNKGPEFMQAQLRLIVTNECEHEYVTKLANGTDKFIVHFLRPVNIEAKSAKSFTDGVDFGAAGSVLKIKDVVQLSDWRNYAKSVTAYNFDPNHANYYQYYGVDSIKVDVAGITPSGLNINGVELTTLPSTIIIDQDGSIAPTYGTLTYKNNGNTLVDGFTLNVPVTVYYKWGMVSKTIQVPVNPTSTANPVRRK